MKRFVTALCLFLVVCIFSTGLSILEAKTITMDGEFDDWDDVDILVEDTIEDYPYSGTIYYYNTGTSDWQTNAIADTCMYTANRALDLGEFRLTNDNDFLYILWKRGSDFLNYYWRRGDATEEYSFSNEPAPDYQANPCVGEIVTAPANFNHDLVLKVDTDNDDTYDYFLVIRVSFQEGAYSDYDTAGYIYEDNGDGEYLFDVDTVVATFGESDYEVSPSSASVDSAVLQEVKMDISEILTHLDLNWGATVTVQYETHSELVDETDPGEFTFTQDEEESEDHTFTKDRRCLAAEPLPPQWVRRTLTVGGVNLLWSAMGGDRVDIEITNGAGEYEYKYVKVFNTGHMFLPNVGAGQKIRVRVYNVCLYGDWLII